jgi:hypothetical protein
MSLIDLSEELELAIEERDTARRQVATLTHERDALRKKAGNQRQELKRLNASHLAKNARLVNNIVDIEHLKQVLLAVGVRTVMLPSDIKQAKLEQKSQDDLLGQLSKIPGNSANDDIPF